MFKVPVDLLSVKKKKKERRELSGPNYQLLQKKVLELCVHMTGPPSHNCLVKP